MICNVAQTDTKTETHTHTQLVRRTRASKRREGKGRDRRRRAAKREKDSWGPYEERQETKTESRVIIIQPSQHKELIVYK
jgi:hypothetical protein